MHIKNILDIFGKLNSDKRYTAGEDTGNEYIIELAKNLEVKRKQSSNKAENKSEEKHLHEIFQVLTKLNKESSSGGTEYLLEFSNVGVQTGKGNLAKMNTINNKKLELNKKQDLNRTPELNKKPCLNKNPELNKKQENNKIKELDNKHEPKMNSSTLKASLKPESVPEVWTGSWTQPMPGVPEVHDFHWQFTDVTKWTGHGWDKKGNFTLKEMPGGKIRKFRIKYISGIFKCKLMEYIVTEGDLSKAAGKIKYKDCKYDNGQKLVGDTGTWKAKKTEDIENDVSKEDTNTGEDVYEYDHLQ